MKPMRFLLWRVCTLSPLLVLFACTPPSPTATRRPTFTPPREIIVIVTPERRSPAPTWRLSPTPGRTPTRTRARTRLPSPTPLPTRTPLPSATPIGGAVGIISTQSLLTIELDNEAITEAVQAQRLDYLYASEVNSGPVATLAEDHLHLSVNFNDFTERGLPAAFDFGLFIDRGHLGLNLLNLDPPSGISGPRIRAAMRLMRSALADVAIPRAIREYQPDMASYAIRWLVYDSQTMLVTVQITALVEPTPAP